MNFLSSLMSTLLLAHLLLSAGAATLDTTITDVEGNPLDVHSAYYIESAGIGFTGGFRVKNRPDQNQSPFTCPKFVYRSRIEVDPGTPVKFTPSDPTQTTITSSTDTRISFAAVGMTCPKTWSLTRDSGITYVSTGVYVDRVDEGVKGTHLNAPFVIKPVEGSVIPNTYIITYSAESGVGFGALALFDEDETSWLGLTFTARPSPLHVYFVKMTDNLWSKIM